jgi:hypothetical protein
MTDAFLTKLVKEALVAPLVIDLGYDKMTRELRNEEIETRGGTTERKSPACRSRSEARKTC